MAGFPLRAKIQALLQKGGEADPDAPNDPESYLYWVTKKKSVDGREGTKFKSEVQAQVTAQSAMDAFTVDPGAATRLALPDIKAMMDSMPATPNSVGPSVPASSAPLRGVRELFLPLVCLNCVCFHDDGVSSILSLQEAPKPNARLRPKLQLQERRDLWA